MERQAFKLLSDMERSWWYRGRAAAVRSALERCTRGTFDEVLDFGAGYGGMYSLLSEMGTRVYAFEPDLEAQEAAKKRGYVDVFRTEREAFSRAYDLVGLFDVVEHIEFDREFLVRAKLALRDNGRVAITVPAFKFLWSVHDVNHHHYRRYTKASIRHVLEEAGFLVEYTSYWNMTLFIPALLMRLLGQSGESALSMPRFLNAIFYAIVRVESSLMRFFSLPFGTGLVVIARKKQ